jgi:hypothetical protein
LSGGMKCPGFTHGLIPILERIVRTRCRPEQHKTKHWGKEEPRFGNGK